MGAVFVAQAWLVVAVAKAGLREKRARSRLDVHLLLRFFSRDADLDERLDPSLKSRCHVERSEASLIYSTPWAITTAGFIFSPWTLYGIVLWVMNSSVRRL